MIQPAEIVSTPDILRRLVGCGLGLRVWYDTCSIEPTLVVTSVRKDEDLVVSFSEEEREDGEDGRGHIRRSSTSPESWRLFLFANDIDHLEETSGYQFDWRKEEDEEEKDRDPSDSQGTVSSDSRYEFINPNIAQLDQPRLLSCSGITDCSFSSHQSDKHTAKKIKHSYVTISSPAT
jgi:hypothetical protein